ncbi:diaminobutyrate acetyltransferase [Orrella sp. JC864]|uniref:diaminobutyrate acetyltransferase n=1 Tax=Orrella sp. JC864 TaxID=3120298 RepID=UPI003008FF30
MSVQAEGDAQANALGAPYGLRQPRRTDGAAIHALIAACPPLDLNSVYAYLLQCEHFAQTGVVAEREGRIDGFISAYVPPGRPDVLFVWQVAVHERARGHGLGQRMLAEILGRPACAAVRFVETTVGPDNQASRGMFAALARQRQAGIEESPLFPASLFGEGPAHEDEMLLRIGPFKAGPPGGAART